MIDGGNTRLVREQSPDGVTLILGVGNVLLGDEGFGVHVARCLKEVKLPDYVRVQEGGVDGFNLLGHLEGVTRLVIVDVMMIDYLPGTLVLFEPGTDLAEPGKRIVSFHQVGVLELIQMGGLIGYQPKVLFLVTRPENMEMSMELSPTLQNTVAKAVNLIKELSLNHFTDLERSKSSCTV